MRIIFTESFLKKEYKSLKKYYSLFDLEDFIFSSKNRFISLSSLGYKNCRLVKIKITKQVASRMIVYIFTSKDIAVPLILVKIYQQEIKRLKN